MDAKIQANQKHRATFSITAATIYYAVYCARMVFAYFVFASFGAKQLSVDQLV